MKVAFLIFLIWVIGIKSYCQEYFNRLMELAVIPGSIIYTAPLKTLFLDKKDLWTYQANLQELKEPVDTTVILEIITNSKIMDSSYWAENELPNVILIKSDSDQIPLRKIKFIKKKISLTSLNYIKKFNSTPVDKRNILEYSRPVFDKSGNYAIIAYRSNLQWGAIIFHFINNDWLKLGVVVKWVV